MMIDLLKITESEALLLADDKTQEFTPGVDNDDNYYFYKESYTTIELESVKSFLEEDADGLTPVNPGKPMFPRKP